MLQILRKIGLTGALLILSANTFAQTNGSWTVFDGNWSDTANWQNGVIADNGGIASFNSPAANQTYTRTITLDTVSRTLSEIRFGSAESTTITSSGGATLSLLSSGLILNSIYGDHTISAPITGTGDLIKTGAGSLSLSNATSSFTGTIRVNQGFLRTSSASLGNAANSIELNGGGLTGTFANGIQIGANGGEFGNEFGSVTHTGLLTGSGSLIISGTTTLQGDGSGFNGTAFVVGGPLTLSGNGHLGGATSVLANVLTLNNSSTNLNNRLGGGVIVGRGGGLLLTGNSGAATTEALGNLTLEYGLNSFSVSANLARSSTLSFTGLSRQNNSTVIFDGSFFGSAPGAGIGTILFSTSPGTLIGGGGSPTSSTTASILPWAIGVDTFVTWDATTQRILPLSTTSGYATNLTTANALDNVSLNNSVNLAAPKTVNSLRLAPSSSITIGGSLLTLTSGALLYTSSSTTLITTISAPLTAADGGEFNLFTRGGDAVAGTGLVVTGAISGTGGLTISGLVHLLGSNTYTGLTTLNSGTIVVPGGTFTADGSSPSALGQDTSPIRLAEGNLKTTGNLTIDRNLDVRLAGSGTVGLGTIQKSSNESITVNGNISLNKAATNSSNEYLTLTNGHDSANAITFNGTISGNGGLLATGTNYLIFNGNNTYSGGTVLGQKNTWTGTGDNTQYVTGIYEIGSDTAFGTGTITAYGGTFLATGGPRTISNPISIPYGQTEPGLTGASVRFEGNFPITLSGPIDLGTSFDHSIVFTIGANSPVTISGPISHHGISKLGPGTLTLSGINPINRPSYIRQGTLSVSTLGNEGEPGNLGTSSNSWLRMYLSGHTVGDTGILRYTGAGETTDRLFTIDGSGGTIDASGSGALKFGSSDTIYHGWGRDSTLFFFSGYGGGRVFLVGDLGAISVVVGSTVSGNGVPAGTIVTEVGTNWLRVNNAISGNPFVTITAPASLLPVRTLTLTGSNTGLNTITPVLTNSYGSDIYLAVNKTGPGTWSLNGANDYSGGTTINGGTLLVNNTAGSGTGTGGVAVNLGGTFGGNGSIAGALTVNSGGTVAPGNSPGLLTINNDVVFNSGSNLAIELNGNTPGVNYDQLAVNGGITLGNANLLFALGFAPSASDFFYIVNNDLSDAVLGTFAGLPQGSDIFATFGGNTYKGKISYTGDYNTTNFLGSGNDIVLFGFLSAAVPEPGTFALIGLSLPGMILLLRREKA
ncbi:MAG: autotransporter-associated beta strand repeat-containing protein [Armatimonas sp.]